ncbi:MAG: hypothetical protein LBK73_02845 [Treponema sp.]|nr:hypothetical protein [Treponema sp.]
MADAGDEPARGSDKADCWLHYAIGLFDLGMKEMALTVTETGGGGGCSGLGRNDFIYITGKAGR